jgi:phage I-like protein
MRRAALRSEVIIADPYGYRQPPSAFRVFAAGLNRSDKGDFLFDEQAAAAVMEAFRQKAIDISIDYDHQSTATPQVSAPAAGWCRLELRAGALWATSVRWTPRAQAALDAGEYRYFSPLFNFDEDTGRITKLINIALTNTPALHELRPLVAASSNIQTGASPMRTTEQQAIQAVIANRVGGPIPRESQASLSGVGGTAGERARLIGLTDEQILAEAEPERLKMWENTFAHHGNRKALAAHARQVRLTALDGKDREAQAGLVERGRMLLNQGQR